MQSSYQLKKYMAVAGGFILFGVLGFGTIQQQDKTSSKIIATGKFKGKNNHATTGSISIIKTSSGYLVLLEPDFKFDGAPAPRLGFGNNGYDPVSKFSELISDQGAQLYIIPSSINPEIYRQLWLWCEKFDVPLGLAILQ